MRETVEHGGDRKSRLRDETLIPRLEDMGINKAASHRWQTVAELPEEQFEQHIAAELARGALVIMAIGRSTRGWAPARSRP